MNNDVISNATQVSQQERSVTRLRSITSGLLNNKHMQIKTGEKKYQ